MSLWMLLVFLGILLIFLTPGLPDEFIAFALAFLMWLAGGKKGSPMRYYRR